MAKPIYVVYVNKARESWSALPKERQDELLAKVRAAHETVGATIHLICDASWAQQYDFFGVEEFPDIEALQRYQAILNEFNWNSYFGGIGTIGTKME